KWAHRHPVAALLWMIVIAAIPASFVAVLEYQRQREARLLREHDELIGRQTDGLERLRLARGQMAGNNLTGAEVTLTSLKEKMQGDDRLSTLRAEVEDILGEVKRRQADQLARKSDRDRFEAFLKLRDDALFHDTRFTGLDLSGDRDAPRRAALAA